VSIVIVAWRAREDVLRCLASIDAHVRLDHECIVVDDGSGDGTPEAVGERHPLARMIAKSRNSGLVAGRNTALSHVRGRYVLMLDADTEVCEGAVDALAAILERRPDVGIAGPRLDHPDGELQLSCRRWSPLMLPFIRRGPVARLMPDPASHRHHLMMDFDHTYGRPVVWVMGAAQMWRRELAEEIGPYDPRISSYGGEDLDWCLRTWATGQSVWYAPEARIVHRFQKVTNQSPYGAKSRRALRDFYYLQWKHRDLRRDPRLDEARR
jgi:GT2 family glycosyltransferase